MSATLDAALFSNYFGGAPVVKVPGRTYPVQSLFLEDALAMTGHVVTPGAKWAARGNEAQGEDSECEQQREEFSTQSLQERYAGYDPGVWAALQTLDQDAVNYELLVQLICAAVSGDEILTTDAREAHGAVLVFLPGAKEISTLQQALLQTPQFWKEPARSWILALHGSLPPEEQRKVFRRPPVGVKKVVLATNVAETSITIDDVSVVVDSARMKEMRFDSIRRLSSLEDVVVARSNARQRRGRAGRVAAGVAVHLITKYRHDNLIDDHQQPEVRRVPLEQLILRIHSIKTHLAEGPSTKGRNAAAVCAQLLQPPTPTAVEKAVEELVRLGALVVDHQEGTEELTPLGCHLARLPVDARIGKLILLGAVFGPEVTDHALTIAAALTHQSPFQSPMHLRDQADRVRRCFAEALANDRMGLSDHLAVLSAYCEMDALPSGQKVDFCWSNYLAPKIMQAMGGLKRQLLEQLSSAGFVRPGLRAHEIEALGHRDGSDGVRLALLGTELAAQTPVGLQAKQGPLLAALLCAALFPQVARVAVAQSSSKKRKAGGNEQMKLYVQMAGEEVEVKIHPSSVAAWKNKVGPGFVVYHELVKTTQLYMRDVTPVPPLALLLFGGALEVESTEDGAARLIQGPAGEEVLLTVDKGWVQILAPARLLQALTTVRAQLDALLRRRTERGCEAAADRSAADAEDALLGAVVKLLDCGAE